MLLLMALAVRRYLNHVARLQSRLTAAWRPPLARIAMEPDEMPPLPPLPHRHLPYVMEEWNALHEAVRGDPSARLNAVALKLGLDVAARRLIHSRRVGRQILAIRTLGHLKDPSSWKPLQEQLGSQNALVSFYAAAALVRIDAQRAMPGIMNQLAERESWPAEAMARLLTDVGADIAREPIRALMFALAPAKLPPLLPWLAHVDAVLGSEVAVELLRRHPDNAEIVAAALMVVLDPGALPELARFADVRGRRRAPEPRRRLRPARRARGRRDRHAPDVRQGLVGALPRGPGAPDAQGHDRRPARGGARPPDGPLRARHARARARGGDARHERLPPRPRRPCSGASSAISSC